MGATLTAAEDPATPVLLTVTYSEKAWPRDTPATGVKATLVTVRIAGSCTRTAGDWVTLARTLPALEEALPLKL